MMVLLGSGASSVSADSLPTQGRLVDLQAGDVACYAEIEVAGESQILMADFPVCEQSALIGQPVRFAWTQAQVLAADCEGDVDCGRSDTVDLIDRMMAVPTRAACGDGEHTAFSCRIGTKQVAVCFVAAEAGDWLQYRFGRPGQVPELVWPDGPMPAARAAEGRVETYAGGGSSWLRFRRGDHAYVVYTGVGRWGAGGETVERSGVVVERHGDVIARLNCDDLPSSELGPDWFEQLGVRASDTSEFFIPEEAP
jgi:hypothetical protein